MSKAMAGLSLPVPILYLSGSSWCLPFFPTTASSSFSSYPSRQFLGGRIRRIMSESKFILTSLIRKYLLFPKSFLEILRKSKAPFTGGRGRVSKITAAHTADLSSSVPQNPWKELGMAACTSVPALEKEVSGTSWLSSLVKSVSSEFCEKTCLKK